MKLTALQRQLDASNAEVDEYRALMAQRDAAAAAERQLAEHEASKAKVGVIVDCLLDGIAVGRGSCWGALLGDRGVDE